MRPFTWLLCFVISIEAAYGGAEYSPLPVTVFGRPRKGFLHNPFRRPLERDYDPSTVISGTVTQKLDNFDETNTATWEQYYQYNPKFYNGSGLAFLMIGGESKIGLRWIADDTYTYLTWAKKYGAAAFQAEHRFYGDSHPLEDMSLASYQYFTIDQALADLRVFILEMNKKYFSNVTNPRWVLFGGSYPGSLAAWFRANNSDITIGAISSSSAVNTQLDYYGYAVNMEYTYRDVSEACAENIRQAFQLIVQKTYTTEGRNELVEKLKLDPPFNETSLSSKDIQFFLSNVFTLFQSINQYTGDNRDEAHKAGLGVPRACEIMNNVNESDLIRRIGDVWDFYNGFYYDTTYKNPNSYEEYIAYMRNTTYDPPDYERAAARGWAWQTCTELGYFQTTDGGNGIFGSLLPMDFYVDQCISIFNETYDVEFTKAGTARTREKYGGGDNYKGSKCSFPNGSYDPWKSLGYSKNDTDKNVSAFLIEGTAHCADMYPANDTYDKPSLKQAREFLAEQLDFYIRSSLEPTSPDPASTTPSSASKYSSTTPSSASKYSIYFVLLAVTLSFLFITL